MKISKIHVANMLRISGEVSIDPTAPIMLVAGENEAGKSSLMDSISYALVGKIPRVGLKKNLIDAVSTGKENGFAEVCTEEGGSYSAAIPSGKGVHYDHFALPVAMEAGRFASMAENDRRTFLFELSGLSCDRNHIADRLLSRGCDRNRVDEITPLLRTGFQAAETEARAKVRDQRAAWKAITGETYGEKKAETWKMLADKPAFDAAAIGVQQQKLEAANAELSAANQRIGAMQADYKRKAESEIRIEELREKGKKHARIASKLLIDEDDLKEWEEKVESARQRAAGGRKQGLIHDLAFYLNESLRMAIPFGEMDARQKQHLSDANSTLGRYSAEYGSIESSGDVDIEAQSKLPEYEKALSLMQRTIANSKRDLAEAEAANRAVIELESASYSAPSEEEIKAAKDALGEIALKQQALSVSIDLALEAERTAKLSDERTAKALEAHLSAMKWSKIADALAPDGIPGEMLSDALKPLNDRLRATAIATGWDQVSVDADMTIRINSRLYSLGSLSARYRASLALVEAVSHLSGLKFFAIDEFDCLDAHNRMVGLKWLHQLAVSGDIDTVMVFGTFKHPPQAPKTFQVLWMEKGSISCEPPIRSAA